MQLDELLKKEKEILDNACCWESLENEVLKFHFLICNCLTHVEKNGEDFISRKYLIRKSLNLLMNHPIILDAQTAKIYANARIRREINQSPKGK